MLTASHEATKALILESEMSAPEQFSFSDGRVVGYCRTSPDKQEPNDDSAIVIQAASGAIVMAVADGVGGSPMGYEASAIAVRTLAASLSTVCTRQDLRPLILDAIEHANQEILDLGVGAATTLSVVEIQAGIARAYQVGDSISLIMGQRGVLKWKSTPQSPTGYAVESGLMDEFDAMFHDERHLVSNLVGTRDMQIQIGPAQPLAARDTVLLGSDGLFDNLHLDEVVQIGRIGAPLDRVRNLVQKTQERMSSSSSEGIGKPDDLSLLLFTQ
ncbi:MAG: PP2C family protein-serine/threonine phosphatase [Rubripirellula sp.]